MNTHKKLKIGILSFAHLHAEAYVLNLLADPGVEMIGIADEDLERGRKFAGQFGVRLFASYAALLAEQPDGVLVCSENSRHRPLVELAAAAGVHVLCEKPLATTPQDARAMVQACKQAGVILMTAFPVRFSPPVSELRSRLAAGDLGLPYCFNAINQGELPRKHREWFVDPELAGGGAVADHTVHLADIMRWYLGSEVREVYAQTNQIFHGDEVEVETGGLVMLTFENGVFATIDTSWSRPDYWPTWGGLGLELVTERGAVIVDAFKQNLTVYRPDLQRPVWSFWGSDINAAMIAEFLAAIREGRQPLVTGEDGLRAVEIVAAAYRSAESGQPALVERG
ncbi:MAG: Gfo/Idh/MocA family protein [Chloroflexota bacterium]